MQDAARRACTQKQVARSRPAAHLPGEARQRLSIPCSQGSGIFPELRQQQQYEGDGGDLDKAQRREIPELDGCLGLHVCTLVDHIAERQSRLPETLSTDYLRSLSRLQGCKPCE